MRPLLKCVTVVKKAGVGHGSVGIYIYTYKTTLRVIRRFGGGGQGSLRIFTGGLAMDHQGLARTSNGLAQGLARISNGLAMGWQGQAGTRRD